MLSLFLCPFCPQKHGAKGGVSELSPNCPLTVRKLSPLRSWRVLVLIQARRSAARTSTRHATERTEQKSQSKATGRGFAAEPLGDSPAHTVPLLFALSPISYVLPTFSCICAAVLLSPCSPSRYTRLRPNTRNYQRAAVSFLLPRRGIQRHRP